MPGVCLIVEIGARSDVGRARATNEDCYSVVRELSLFVVSDGMGGEAKGEMASAIAVEAVTTHCMHGAGAVRGTNVPQGQHRLSDKTRRLASGVEWANRKIRSAAAKNPAHRGMGATLVAGWLDGSVLSVVHVGDSRAYIIRAGHCKQLTRDHSLAAERERRGLINRQEAQTSKLQNVLLRALGPEDHVEVDAEEFAVQDGDVVLLCTDGLTHSVSDSDIAGTLAATDTAQEATDRLITMANERGGNDNITVIVLRLRKDRDGLVYRLRRRFSRSEAAT